MMQQVKGFSTYDERTFHEGLANGGVHHEIISVDVFATISLAAIHITIHYN